MPGVPLIKCCQCDPIFENNVLPQINATFNASNTPSALIIIDADFVVAMEWWVDAVLIININIVV